MTDLQLPWQAQAELEESQKASKYDLELHSVTSILRYSGSADGLIGWAVGRTADAAINDAHLWLPLVNNDRVRDARAYLTGARWRPRAGCTLTDAEAGTLFHKKAEQWIFEGRRPNCDNAEVNLLLDSYGKWLDAMLPTFDALEMTVYHPEEGYAGTLDAIINVDGKRYVLDYKTTLDDDSGKDRKRPWHSVAPQLAAYRNAKYVAVWKARTATKWSRRYYLLSEDERRNALPMPEIEGGYCLHISPVHADLYYVRTGLDVFRDGFLSAVDSARWHTKLADSAIDEDSATYLNTQP